jgi:CRP-like cAMP-binding protein
MLEAFGPDIELIRPHLRRVALRAGQVLAEPGDRIASVYFQEAGIVSKMAVFEDGAEIECALVGREGAVGAMSALGLKTSLTRDICHLPVRARVIEASRLSEAAMRAPRIHAALDHYCAWKMSCAVRNGACNARHSVEQRLCRWVLTCCDVLETRQILLSQDVFAKMLGVQRTSVNPILQRLRGEGLIELGRARLSVLDPHRLRARSCECYAAVKHAELEIWAPADQEAPALRRNANSAA